MSTTTTGAIVPVTPLSQRLRTLVETVAGTKTVTCVFKPGGRLQGAGIVGPNYCVHCNQARMWHTVAAAIADVAFAEAMRAQLAAGELGASAPTEGEMV
jgi:hypothetical protein